MNLVNNPAVTHAAILQPHFLATRQRMLERPGVILVVSDRVTLDYSGLHVACLGPIGNGHGKGFECHNSLAIDPANGDLLGLTAQILHVRDSDIQIEAERQARAKSSEATPKPKGKGKRKRRRPDEPAAQRHERRSRETRQWIEGSIIAGGVPEDRKWIAVCDRASDTWEYLCFMDANQRLGVIRSKHNRALEGEEDEGGVVHRSQMPSQRA